VVVHLLLLVILAVVSEILISPAYGDFSPVITASSLGLGSVAFLLWLSISIHLSLRFLGLVQVRAANTSSSEGKQETHGQHLGDSTCI